MSKIVINSCFGGFSLSPLGTKRYYELKGINDNCYLDNRPNKRDDPDLVRTVEELGDAANGTHAKLKIVEVPDGVEWTISEYDGIESVEEKHRSWS